MICRNCRRAGKLLQQFRESAALLDDIDLVTQQHEFCKGGSWCDCQHKLAGVNYELERLNSAHSS